MKLENTNSVFNLGDTSFRRKTLLDDYKVILPILKNHMEKVDRWGKIMRDKLSFIILS